MLASRFRQIGRAVGNAQRFRTIVHVFLKYGYEDLARKLPLPRFWRWLRTPSFRRECAKASMLSRPERLRKAFEELGPAFVKLGQLLSSRTRLLPPEYVDELAKLNDQVPPIPFGEVQAVIEAELRKPIAECFRSIHRKLLEWVYEHVLLLALNHGAMKLGRVAIYGSKVKANASKHRAMS